MSIIYQQIHSLNNTETDIYLYLDQVEEILSQYYDGDGDEIELYPLIAEYISNYAQYEPTLFRDLKWRNILDNMKDVYKTLIQEREPQWFLYIVENNMNNIIRLLTNVDSSSSMVKNMRTALDILYFSRGNYDAFVDVYGRADDSITRKKILASFYTFAPTNTITYILDNYGPILEEGGAIPFKYLSQSLDIIRPDTLRHLLHNRLFTDIDTVHDSFITSLCNNPYALRVFGLPFDLNKGYNIDRNAISAYANDQFYSWIYTKEGIDPIDFDSYFIIHLLRYGDYPFASEYLEGSIGRIEVYISHIFNMDEDDKESSERVFLNQFFINILRVPVRMPKHIFNDLINIFTSSNFLNALQMGLLKNVISEEDIEYEHGVLPSPHWEKYEARVFYYNVAEIDRARIYIFLNRNLDLKEKVTEYVLITLLMASLNMNSVESVISLYSNISIDINLLMTVISTILIYPWSVKNADNAIWSLFNEMVKDSVNPLSIYYPGYNDIDITFQKIFVNSLPFLVSMDVIKYDMTQEQQTSLYNFVNKNITSTPLVPQIFDYPPVDYYNDNTINVVDYIHFIIRTYDMSNKYIAPLVSDTDSLWSNTWLEYDRLTEPGVMKRLLMDMLYFKQYKMISSLIELFEDQERYDIVENIIQNMRSKTVYVKDGIEREQDVLTYFYNKSRGYMIGPTYPPSISFRELYFIIFS